MARDSSEDDTALRCAVGLPGSLELLLEVQDQAVALRHLGLQAGDLVPSRLEHGYRDEWEEDGDAAQEVFAMSTSLAAWPVLAAMPTAPARSTGALRSGFTGHALYAQRLTASWQPAPMAEPVVSGRAEAAKPRRSAGTSLGARGARVAMPPRRVAARASP
eukprot:CAMPEP_0175365370 /NCGR_PEP_ID=MMETSP0095-20121207/18589_1 /TAXON_ID=311494 /ORGANISM="Alexandrium monilatum, Strain CCMP3105" /LENGTH=160 /DNA_ID=CAMNT_0016663349 /DNA_START=112 /DNA_END=591 /DNA_ORIENTATION=+